MRIKAGRVNREMLRLRERLDVNVERKLDVVLISGPTASNRVGSWSRRVRDRSASRRGAERHCGLRGCECDYADERERAVHSK